MVPNGRMIKAARTMRPEVVIEEVEATVSGMGPLGIQKLKAES
jgi:hypothetical protein